MSDETPGPRVRIDASRDYNFADVRQKILNVVGKDVDEIADEECGRVGPMQERHARRIARYATAICALENAGKLKDMHGEGCECRRCTDAIMTVEKALEQRMKARTFER